MRLATARARVAEWDRRAAAWDAAKHAHRVAIRDWKHKRFANPGALAWAFAAGAWLGSGRHIDPGRTRRRARSTKKVVGLANAVLLAWRVLGAPR